MSQVSKALAALSAALVTLVAAGVLSGASLDVANIAIAVVGALIVGAATWEAPANKPAAPKVE